MIRTLIIAALVCCVARFASAQAAPAADKRSAIEGTWERPTIDGAPGARQIKIINATHVVWAIIDAQKNTVVLTGGGTYTLKGNTYIEVLEFTSADSGLPDLIGKEQKFKVTVGKDSFKQVGKLTSGQEIDETWKRVVTQSSTN